MMAARFVAQPAGIGWSMTAIVATAAADPSHLKTRQA